MGRIRRSVVVLTVSIGAAILPTGVPGGATEAEPPSGPLRIAYEESGSRLPGAFSSGGEFAIAAPAGFVDSRLISMADGTTWPSDVTRPVPTSNGAFVFGNPDDQTIERYDVVTGITSSRAVPFEDVGAAWRILDSVADADEAGRFVLFRGSSAALGRSAVFLYDFETNALVRSNGDAISGDVTNAIPETVSADGSVVVYRELRDASWTTVRWDRTTDSRTDYGPTGDVATRGGDLSPDFEWELFTSADAELPSGTDVGLHYYRRSLASGWIGIVDVDPDDVRSADIYADGRVVMRVRTPTPRVGDPSATADQLFVSDPGRPAQLISVTSDGSPAPNGIGTSFAADADATEISFTSFDRDLSTGTGEEGWRWYVAEIPARITQVDGSATATAHAVRCSRSADC